ncbi:hypothetical protein [Azospirillum sp. sgz302134]
MRRRSLLMAAALAIFVGLPGGLPAGMAAEPTPEAFVSGLYRHYVGKGARGLDLHDPALCRRLFTPDTAALLTADRREVARLGETGRLDFDIFVAGQDWELAKPPQVRAEPTGRTSATVIAEGVNGLGPATVRYDLVKTDAGWRIQDMRWTDIPDSLRAILQRPY